MHRGTAPASSSHHQAPARREHLSSVTGLRLGTRCCCSSQTEQEAAACPWLVCERTERHQQQAVGCIQCRAEAYLYPGQRAHAQSHPWAPTYGGCPIEVVRGAARLGARRTHGPAPGTQCSTPLQSGVPHRLAPQAAARLAAPSPGCIKPAQLAD